MSRFDRDVPEELASELAGLAQPLAAPRPLRARILASVAGHFEGFVERVAALFDLSSDEAREQIARIPAAEAWTGTPLPGLRLIHLRGGPRVAAADCGFVRLEPGTTFPHHFHEGDEWALVLRGRADDSTGAVSLPGDLVHFGVGSSHSFRAAGPVPLLFAVVQQGLRFGPAR
jgi:quercetin dioxygenase-like cupin family protein